MAADRQTGQRRTGGASAAYRNRAPHIRSVYLELDRAGGCRRGDGSCEGRTLAIGDGCRRTNGGGRGYLKAVIGEFEVLGDNGREGASGVQVGAAVRIPPGKGRGAVYNQLLGPQPAVGVGKGDHHGIGAQRVAVDIDKISQPGRAPHCKALGSGPGTAGVGGVGVVQRTCGGSLIDDDADGGGSGNKPAPHQGALVGCGVCLKRAGVGNRRPGGAAPDRAIDGTAPCPAQGSQYLVAARSRVG